MFSFHCFDQDFFVCLFCFTESSKKHNSTEGSVKLRKAIKEKMTMFSPTWKKIIHFFAPVFKTLFLATYHNSFCNISP